MISAKSSPPPVEILYNPYTTESQYSDSSSANATEILIDDCVVSLEEKAKDSFTQLVNTVSEGLRYHPPELCDEGENGTYFLRDRDGKRVAVFKCADEEGISSPKRKAVPSLLVEQHPEDDEYFKQFHLEISGESDQHSKETSSNMEQQITDCIKNEVAPFVLDLQANRFYSVPQTGLVAIHPPAKESKKTDSKKKSSGNYFATTKVGSLQEFVDSDGTASDVGPVLFPVKEVHKIGILDLQILNLDRHLGNLLIKNRTASASSNVPQRPTTSPHLAFSDRRQTLSGVSFFSGQGPVNAKYESDPSSLPSSWPRNIKSMAGEFVLIPIDHGYSLPRSFASVKDLWFEWITFPQAKRPFDEETKQFIEAIDIETNVHLFHELGICEESIKIMEVTTTLLKKCAKANWTLYDIAMLLVNSSLRDDDEPSALEDLIEEAEEDYEVLLSNGDRPLSPSTNTRVFINLISQKIDDLIQQHQQMLLTQQQFERN